MGNQFRAELFESAQRQNNYVAPWCVDFSRSALDFGQWVERKAPTCSWRDDAGSSFAPVGPVEFCQFGVRDAFRSILVTSEYRNGAVNRTVLLARRRIHIVTAKAAVSAVVGLVFGLCGIATSLVTSGPRCAISGTSSYWIPNR